MDKSGEWEGSPYAILEVNGKVVDCGFEQIGDPAIISFDADDPEHYERSTYCGLTLTFS